MAAAFILPIAFTIACALVWLIIKRTDKQAIRDAIREADIERQIQSLRNKADHAVQTRPRVRANACAGQAGHIKAPPRADKPKACGGGLCRHRADCSDHYCPGRLAATLSGTDKP
jgi:hypothetical protein